ncbi:MAG: SDR family NAD(P)-dependent oxidoreductase [Actinobacteria bacterium]|nr:SDR family NAD(P)-dependent oxidoreductase [Actinomycetota bacterium]
MAGSAGVVAPGRVAVVTGAASGIGLGLAERFVAEGMSVVLADVEEPALSEAAAKLASQGAVIPVRTDVSSAEQVDALRDEAVRAFGAVHLVCNNAGVGGPHGPLWQVSAGDWEWVLRVNLGGVINGVRAFVPLLAQQDVAHIVNTASVFGVFAGALGPYGISKHAIVALSETLYFQLRSQAPTVGLSVLCPGAVRTRFGSSARNRPAWAGPVPEATAAERASAEQFDRLQEAAGADPAEVAAAVVDGIRASRFYILTSTNRSEAIRRRGEEIVAGGPPTPPFP